VGGIHGAGPETAPLFSNFDMDLQGSVLSLNLLTSIIETVFQ
jgi:hypothetical protein